MYDSMFNYPMVLVLMLVIQAMIILGIIACNIRGEDVRSDVDDIKERLIRLETIEALKAKKKD